jgi:hypothetical protein
MAWRETRAYCLPDGTGGWWPNHFLGDRHFVRGTRKERVRLGYDTRFAKTSQQRRLVTRFRAIGLVGRYVWVVATPDNEPLIGFSLPGDWETGNPRGVAEYIMSGYEFGRSAPASSLADLGKREEAKRLLDLVVRDAF